MMSYANYLYIAIRAAVDAGKSIMDIYNDPESDFGIERKADNSRSAPNGRRCGSWTRWTVPKSLSRKTASLP